MKKILVLEDNKETAFLYERMLKANSYEVTVGYDGLEGLTILKLFKPDLIILDVNMPRLSGVGFYQEICDTQGIPSYPLLVVTGRMDLELTFRSLPVAGLMLKPINRTKMLDTIKEILGEADLAYRNN